jgi:hypothetical protein
MNNILTAAFVPLPITEKSDTTRKARITCHRTVMAQIKDKMVKLQMFDIPEGAKQIRALSRESINIGPGYDASVWIFVKQLKGKFRELLRATTEHWRLSPEDRGDTLFIIALYNHGLFVNPGDYAGAEIDDLAGEVNTFEFIIGGDVSELQIKDIYRFPPAVPMRFYPYKQDEVEDLSEAQNIVIEEFSDMMGFFRERVGKSNNRRIVSEMWEKILKKEGEWKGFRLRKIHNDIIFRMTGKRFKDYNNNMGTGKKCDSNLEGSDGVSDSRLDSSIFYSNSKKSTETN